MNIKKIAALIIPLFVAAIFVSTYLSNTNFNTPTTATTSVPQTAFAEGIANAIITGYGSPVSINVACSNAIEDNSTISNVTSTLTNMEDNNSISNFYNSNLNFQVATGNLSAYQMYSYFQNSTNSTQFGCLNFTGPAYILLPSAVNFTAGSQEVQIPLNSSYRNNTVVLPLSDGINTQLRLKISALLTANGTIYGPLGLIVIR